MESPCRGCGNEKKSKTEFPECRKCIKSGKIDEFRRDLLKKEGSIDVFEVLVADCGRHSRPKMASYYM